MTLEQTESVSPPKSPSYDNAMDSRDFVTGELYQNISSDGEAIPNDKSWFENYLDIRPTADAPKTSMKLPQLLILIARFMVGANTANMSPPVTLPQPWSSALEWGIVNPGIIFGTEIYKNATRYWMDTVNFWTNEGSGSAGWGLLSFTLKTMAASLPSALIGLGVGALLTYSGITLGAPLARIIAACISPWIFVGTKKIIDYYFPSPEYQSSATPPLHPVQHAAMFAFNIWDAVNIYEFIRVLVKEFGSEAAVNDPRFRLGIIGLYLLLSNVIDPIAFGHSPLYGPAPFEVRVTHEEIGDVADPADTHVINDNNDAELPAADLHIDAAAAERAEARKDKIKNGLVYAACATLAAGAGIAADAVASRVLGDTANASNLTRRLGEAVTVAAAAATQVATVNAAPWVINKTKSCWASLFNNNNHPERPAPPLISPRILAASHTTR